MDHSVADPRVTDAIDLSAIGTIDMTALPRPLPCNSLFCTLLYVRLHVYVCEMARKPTPLWLRTLDSPNARHGGVVARAELAASNVTGPAVVAGGFHAATGEDFIRIGPKLARGSRCRSTSGPRRQ